MFVATAPFEVFDTLRVPCTTVRAHEEQGVGRLWSESQDPARAPRLLWVRTGSRRDRTDHRGVFEVGGARVAGVVCRRSVEQVLDDGTAWTAREQVVDEAGRPVASVMTSERGDVFLPFDPGAVELGLRSESYQRLRGAGRAAEAVRAAARRTYYALRPAMPRRLQLRLRRAWADHLPEVGFPRWPVETGLHDLYDLVLGWAAEVAGEPVPWIAPWPDGAQWCLVLTHDVETRAGCEAVERLRAPERAHGLRSAWNFVPDRYPAPTDTLAGLVADGCEIGVHGLKHDGRDLESRRTLERRRPGMLAAAEAWGATGFRAPATQRSWELMPTLGFDHDSSYTDTDPYEPQPGGCCTWWPFLHEDLVELPITLPQDHTLFEILGHDDASLWRDKAAELRRRGGMVLALSHPDYAHGAALRAWQDLLDDVAREDPDHPTWHALPVEVAAWWRARAESRVAQGPDGWCVVGPAAGRARVREAARAQREPA
jgi:hypothetical protein